MPLSHTCTTLPTPTARWFSLVSSASFVRAIIALAHSCAHRSSAQAAAPCERGATAVVQHPIGDRRSERDGERKDWTPWNSQTSGRAEATDGYSARRSSCGYSAYGLYPPEETQEVWKEERGYWSWACSMHGCLQPRSLAVAASCCAILGCAHNPRLRASFKCWIVTLWAHVSPFGR